MLINLVLFFIPKRQEIYRLYLIKKRKKLACMRLNSNSLRIVNTNVLDWNAIVEIGIYSGNNAQNMPINHNDVWINAIVLAANGNPKFLSLFAFSAKGMFIRQMDNTIWNEWVQIK